MKLYATTTSERASKGQGGNRYLETLIYIDHKEVPRFRLLLQKNNDDSTTMQLIDYKQDKVVFATETKGKKQKGKNCPKCGNRDIWDTAKGAKLNKCWECKTAFENS